MKRIKWCMKDGYVIAEGFEPHTVWFADKSMHAYVHSGRLVLISKLRKQSVIRIYSVNWEYFVPFYILHPKGIEAPEAYPNLKPFPTFKGRPTFAQLEEYATYLINEVL